MDEEQLRDAEELYRTWPTDELVHATTVGSQGFHEEALGLMERELDRRGVSSAEQASFLTRWLQQYDLRRKSLTGIRGYLLLFVIALGAVSYVLAFSAWHSLDAGGGENILWGILGLALACYGFFVSYLLVRKRVTAPQHAWRYVFILVCLEASFFIENWYTGDLELFSFDAWKILLFLLAVLTWLKTSPRIANTYGLQQQVS